MGMNANGPETLLEAVKHYADLDVCHATMARIKWPDGVVACPSCGSVNVGFIATRRMFKCRERSCHKQFSVKVGTIFEDSPLGLDKWFVSIWAITNAKNGISSCELARAIGITQKSAWHMLHRVRHAMHQGSFSKFTGEVESDETYIGGITKNMHRSRRLASGIKGGGGTGKAIVHGVLQRGNKQAKVTSKVKAEVINNTKLTTLLPIVRSAVADGSHLYSDTAAAYTSQQFAQAYVHQMIDHAEMYVMGRCHTNGLENFWSLLKRAISGTYVSVDAPHLCRYVDEEVFRFNERKLNDGQRFNLVMPGVVGKRLMYKTLIGKTTAESLKKSERGESGLAN
jgi:transposase-like protein